jgi:hypothetical protein
MSFNYDHYFIPAFEWWYLFVNIIVQVSSNLYSYYLDDRLQTPYDFFLFTNWFFCLTLLISLDMLPLWNIWVKRLALCIVLANIGQDFIGNGFGASPEAYIYNQV